MKTWQKITSVVLVFTALLSIWLLTREQKSCCLCSSIPYDAPCMIDLETGNIVHLELYAPHEANTFSLISFGNVTGTKETDRKTIKLEVPISEKTTNPALCRNCRKQLSGTIFDRYVLADLSDSSNWKLITIESDLSMVLRCYKITAQEQEPGSLLVNIQGTE